MFEYSMYSTAAWLSRRFPLPFSYWFGLRIADACYRLDRPGREGVEANMRRILAYRGVRPAKGFVKAMTRKTYQYFGKYMVDFFRYSKSFCEEIEGKVGIEHQDYLDEAVAAGRGVIVTTAHFGNWELGGLVMSLLGHPVTGVYRPFGIRRLDRMFTDQRASRGVRLIPLGNSVSGIIRSLREHRVVSLLSDRDFTGRAPACRFFGATAKMPMGAAILSLKTGAPVVPGYMMRQVDDRFLMRFDRPIYPEAMASADAIQRGILDSMEGVIGDYPYQWFIFRNFWPDASESPAEDEAQT